MRSVCIPDAKCLYANTSVLQCVAVCCSMCELSVFQRLLSPLLPIIYNTLLLSPLLPIISLTSHYLHYFPLSSLLLIISITSHYLRCIPLSPSCPIISIISHYLCCFPLSPLHHSISITSHYLHHSHYLHSFPLSPLHPIISITSHYLYYFPLCVCIPTAIPLMVWCVAVCCRVRQGEAGCCSVLQCVAVCCNVLQCVSVCCSVLLCIAKCLYPNGYPPQVAHMHMSHVAHMNESRQIGEHRCNGLSQRLPRRLQ